MIKEAQFQLAFLLLTLLSCQTNTNQQSQAQDSANSAISPMTISGSPIYESENLSINKISDHVYQHISYLNTESFGKVACNGMVVINGQEALVFDTPSDDASSQELIDLPDR